MDRPMTRYAVLRDGSRWDEDAVALAGLEAEPDGALTLARLPGLAEAVALPDPYDVEPSGLAVAADGAIFLSEGSQRRVLATDSRCDVRLALSVATPRGMLLGPLDSLYVADSNGARVLVFALPDLQVRAIWEGHFQAPSGLAADSQGRIYVLDRGLKRVLRFSAWGTPDDAYNQAMDQHPELAAPAFLAVGNDDMLYVSDAPSNSVLGFDADGALLGMLAATAGASPVRPRALLASANWLYVADASDGQIWVFDLSSLNYRGTLGSYRGPVTALAVNAAGDLFVKPGSDETFIRLQAGRGYVSGGALTAGPLDAGEGLVWERVHLRVDGADGASLQTFTSDTEANTPQEADWLEAYALDGLVEAGRYLWLRVWLSSADQQTSPRLLQVQAETTGENYLDYLPATYRVADAGSGFLARWLALFRAELSAREEILDTIHRQFDPLTAPEQSLPWLARWLGFELPRDQEAAASRALLLRLRELYARRGTPAGIRDFVQLYTGVRPIIVEDFRERHVWQLGETSTLGLDTALVAAAPDGMIIPGLTLADPDYVGLRGDYYLGDKFERLALTRIDPQVDFNWSTGSPDTSLLPADDFSVRWTGQIQPRFSETYTFYTVSDDGVRLWIDGKLVIDNWTAHAATEDRGRIVLKAGRWYSIRLEFFEQGGAASIQLLWSCQGLPREVVPRQALYALLDDSATLAGPAQDETVLVGQTVIGQSGPLAARDYGAPLFSETAHLFTVLVPAGQFLDKRRRRALRRILEAEKPAHTDFHLCFVDARMRVGFQARVGIDSIVAGPPEPMELSGTALGLDSVLGGEDASRVGDSARLGHDTRVG